jgi:catechol 2,3-dioxygenase-like lactoylglutathione lyase family enzyme
MQVLIRHAGRRIGVWREGNDGDADAGRLVVGDNDPGHLDGTRRFYEDVLGAQVVTEDPGGIIYRSGDSYFSLYPTEYAGTAQHTLGAFMVADVEAAVADLRRKGVSFEEYDLPGLKTVNGIAELGGIKGAWFKDPEGNILSVVQLPPA